MRILYLKFLNKFFSSLASFFVFVAGAGAGVRARARLREIPSFTYLFKLFIHDFPFKLHFSLFPPILFFFCQRAPFFRVCSPLSTTICVDFLPFLHIFCGTFGSLALSLSLSVGPHAHCSLLATARNKCISLFILFACEKCSSLILGGWVCVSVCEK